MPGVVGARFGVGPLPSFVSFLTLKKLCMQRLMVRNGIFYKSLSVLPVRFAKLLRDKSLKENINGKPVSNSIINSLFRRICLNKK